MSATTPTTADPADLPWVEDFRLDDTGGGEIAFGPDSIQLFMAGPGSEQVRVWNLETKTKTELDVEDERSQIAVSKDGLIAFVVDLGPQETANTASEEDNFAIRVWDPKTGEKVHDFPKNRVGHFEFSPDGKLIVSGGWTDGDVPELNIWDVGTGETLHTLLGHTDNIGQIEFTPDGKKILSTSSDGTVRIWDTETGQQLAVLDHTQNGNSPPRAGAVSPDGKFLVVNHNAGNEAWLWDLETETLAKKLSTTIEMKALYSFGFSPDGTQLAAGGSGVSILWDVETGEVIQEFPRSDVEADVNVAFSPDGEHLVVTDISNESDIGQYTVIYKRNPK